METGFNYFATDDALDPAALARIVEERGHHGLMFSEHTHIPTGSGRPVLPNGQQMPMFYAHTLDPFAASLAAGLASDRLRVGTGVALVAQREPIVMAKEIATSTC